MRLLRFGPPGKEKPAVQLESGARVDASELTADYDEQFFASDGLIRLREWVTSEADKAPVVAESERMGPPVARPSKLVCIGLNYRDHAIEAGMEIPTEPVVFMKATSAISGPFDDTCMPRGSTKMDWEVELAFVIDKTAKYVDEAQAMAHVAGFTVCNDYSERVFQLERGGQWVKGKSADGFAPLGPYLVTPDEFGNLESKQLSLTVNGEVMQDGSTESMIFQIPKLVSYLSGIMTLLPGDVVSTGTPPGVGMGRGRFLKAGDVVEAKVESLGSQRQTILAAT